MQGGWLAVRASLLWPTFPSPPRALGAGETLRAGSDTYLLLSVPGDRTHSSPSSLGGVDSNSRATLPSWQENRATVHCGSRGAGNRPPAEGWARAPVCLSSRLAAGILHEQGRLCWEVGGSRGGPGQGGRLRRQGAATEDGGDLLPKRRARPHRHNRDPSLFLQLLKQPRSFQTGVDLGWELAGSEAASPERGNLRRGHPGCQMDPGPRASHLISLSLRD